MKEQYVVSTFKLPGGCQLVPIGELDYYRRVGQTYLGHAIERSGKVYQEILARQDWGIFALFDAFVADEFIKPAMTQTDYKVTSAVADVLFNSGMLPARIDGIVYPSVAFRHGTNFAVRAEAFKLKMRAVPAETQIIEITNVFGYGIFDWQVLATLKSINPDGSLTWEPSS